MVLTLKNYWAYETVELNDKNVFNLQAKNNEHPLRGILCEMGDRCY